jgi:hypothetical protein
MDIIEFKPIDITHIVITFGLALILVAIFKKQLNEFFQSLQDRPITVTMSGSETKIELDAPVTPRFFTDPIVNPQGDEQDFREWEQRIAHVSNIEQFKKLGFDDLYHRLSSLNDGDLSVINYIVDDSSKKYFNDASMLKYLSIASKKVSYIAFYQASTFVGVISIKKVIAGLASKDICFDQFGDKVKNGQWLHFPDLITPDVGFIDTPSVKVLYQRLSDTGLSSLPLLSNGRLLGLLSYQSVSDELYDQAEDKR